MLSKRSLPYLLVFFFSFGLYAISAGKTLFQQSDTHQYVLLAYSYLHGRLDLIGLPASVYDLTVFQGKWYVPGGPGPAVLMMPFVALFGPNFSDIFFNVLFSALNVTLMYDVVGRLKSSTDCEISESLRVWLTVFFAAGTTHWYIGVLGSVTYNAQIVAVTFMLIYARETLINKSNWKPGLWLGIAFMARPTTIFGVSFYLFLAIVQLTDWRARIQKLLPTLFMLGLFVGLTLLHNSLRFHNPTDFGYEYVQARTPLAKAFLAHGGFNPIFIPCNLYISTLALPFGIELATGTINQLCNHLVSVQIPGAFPMEVVGSSMFLTMPPLIYAFRADWRDPIVSAALIGCLSTFIPLLLYHNTGAAQFGYRYSLDMIVFLVILIANGMETITTRSKLVITASLFINLAGFLLMFYYFYNYEWYQMWL